MFVSYLCMLGMYICTYMYVCLYICIIFGMEYPPTELVHYPKFLFQYSLSRMEQLEQCDSSPFVGFVYRECFWNLMKLS